MNPPILVPYLPNETMDRVISFAPRSVRPLLAHLYHLDAPIPKSLFIPNWTDLNLTLSDHYGELPLVQPYAKDDPLYRTWADQVAREARERKEAALKDKLKLILNRASEEKWGLVKSVKMLSCPSVTHLSMAILSQVEQTMEEFELGGLSYRSLQPHDLPRHDQTLDHTLLGCTLSFNSVHTIRIRSRAIWWQDAAITICALMPNARRVELDLDIHPLDDYSDAEDTYTRFASSLPSSQIQQLRVQWGPDEPGSRVGFDEGSSMSTVGWVNFCPMLSQLLISSPSGDLGADGLGAALNGRHTLRDFCWNWSAADLARVMGQRTMPSVRRLVLTLDQWADTFDPLPCMPDLEHLYFDFHASPGNMPIEEYALQSMPTSPPSSSMLPSFAASLRRNAKLRTFHTRRTPFSSEGFSVFAQLDEIEHCGDFSGHITSMVHGDAELLHARLYQDVVEFANWSIIRDSIHPTHLHTLKHYTTACGSERTRVYERRAGFAWVHYTDFQGKVVPLEVIAEMKRVESGVDDWEKRGVEVGEAAWQVLLDWQKGVLGEAANDAAV